MHEDTQPYVTPRKTLAAKQRQRLDMKGRQHDESGKAISPGTPGKADYNIEECKRKSFFVVIKRRELIVYMSTPKLVQSCCYSSDG